MKTSTSGTKSAIEIRFKCSKSHLNVWADDLRSMRWPLAAFELLKLMNLGNRMHPHMGSDIARLNNDGGGKGFGKKQMSHCNDADRDSILIRKDADLPLVH